MENKNPPNQLTNEEKRALLVEYQVCEQDNAANFQGFWTLAAIFFGLSSVFLAGLIYAVIANEPQKTLVIGIIALVVSAANVFILWNINGWHRRIMFNQRLNLRRMREIEVKLVMRKSLRVLGIEDLKKLKQELNEFEKEENDKDKFDKIRRELLEWCKHKRDCKEYEPTSSKKHFPRILCTLMSLWVLVITAATFLIIPPSVSLLWRGLAASLPLLAYIIYIIYLRVHLLHKEQNT